MDEAHTAHGADPSGLSTRSSGEATRFGATGVTASASSNLAGTTLCSRYRLDRLIGSGGMAQVWEATDGVLGRKVAVKLLHPHLAHDEAFVRRFRQEAIAAARLSNPGIVGVYDTCSDNGHEAIVMELLDTNTLRQQLDDFGPLDADTTTRIGLRLLDALEAAHRAGLVHRDVKPSNILLCYDGRVKIADFGIAKADDATEMTHEGSLLGTATYLAPEQLTGAPIDGRADLYSLGIVLYECVAGRVPFEADTGAAVALARLHRDPIDPRRYRADIPNRLAVAIMRSLQRDPDDRFDSAADFRAALLEVGIAAPQPAPEVTEDHEPPEEEVGFTRSERGWLLPALFILLIATALIVAGLLVRETTSSDSGGGSATSSTVAQLTATPLEIQTMITYDPQGKGDPGENDDIAGRAADGDESTAWRTEAYDQPDFFGSKKGVGLAAVLPSPSKLSTLRVSGNDSGWDAEVYVVDAANLDEFDRSTAQPVAQLNDVRGSASVELGDAEGRAVLIWITNLGDPTEGRHRVEISEVEVDGLAER